MHSLRKWLYKPKKEDPSKLAMFYWADEELTLVATELDSFDGRTDPDRCSILVTELRVCQDKVLSICNDIMDEAIPDARANRDFRVKFPDDVLHENLAGQLWFGAECLAAGSNIVHRELESASMRPLAKALTRSLDNVRCLLREQSLKNSHVYSDKVKEALRIFDRLFAEFELCYVSAMVPIKSAKEYHLQQEIVVLFSETLIRGIKKGLILQDMVDVCDPSLMFTIPRLAIVWGLLVFPEGPFNVDQDPENLSELFRPFFNLLLKIRDLLWTLTKKELATLESMLCSQEEPKNENNNSELKENPLHGLCDFITEYYADHNYKYFVNEFLAFDMFVEKNGNQEAVVDGECQNSKEEDVKADKTLRAVYCERDGAESSHGLENGVSSVANHLAISKSHEMAQNTGRCLLTESRSGAYSQNLLTSNDDGRSHFGKVDGQPYIDNCAHPRLENVSFSSEFVHYFPVNAHSSSRSHSIECDLNSYHTDFCHCEDCYNASLPKRPFSLPMRRTNSCVEIIPSSENHSQDSVFESSANNKLSQSFPTRSGYCRSPGSSRSKYPAVSTHCRRRQLLRNRNELVRLSSVPSGRLSAGWTQDNLNRMRFISSSYTDTPNSTPIKLVKLKQLPFFRKLNSETQQNQYSSCQSVSTASSVEWNSTSPETSSYNSECHDDEEIALALQAAEIASQNNVRSRFKNSSELLHKLFVCISGVADQLQTNYASDLRNILKCVFDMNCSQSLHSSNSTSSLTQNYSHCNETFERTNGCEVADDCSDDSNSDTRQEPSLSEDYLSDPQFYEYAQTFDQMDDEGDIRDRCSVDSAEEALPNSSTTLFIVDMEDENSNLSNNYRVPPVWLPDESSAQCMACEVPFTMIRRRHHCRNCGKLFCSRCSSNSIPLPRFGHLKPVRVCNPCFKSPVASLLSHQQT